ncbi:hypothetical protein [Largemouth bass virus]|uniref:Myristylated membrane protein n=1 Tax=Largemouth bass virus TaxID=176656 RepID=A0A9E7PRU9_9VIRU|nr:hypothetical protein [Largemouth bass virus]
MGAAESVNSVDIVTKAYAEIMTNLVTDQNITADQNQVFSIDHVSGSVVVSGTTFTQKLVVNLSSLMKALTTQSAQDQLVDNIAQQAQAAVSGLNLAQYAYVSNNIDRLITACVKMATDMRVSCTAKVSMTQSFNISNVTGDVTVTDVKLDQFSQLLSSCAMDASVNNVQLRDIISQIKQRGDATVTGLNPLALIAIVVLVMVGTPVGVGFLAGRRAVGPLLLAAAAAGGGALIAGYVPKAVKIKGYVSEPDLDSVVPAETFKGVSLNTAVAMLGSRSDYGALYWKNYTVKNGMAFKMGSPMAYFAPSGYDAASWAGTGPPVPPFRSFPKLFQGEGEPGVRPKSAHGTNAPVAGPDKGDAYLNVTNGYYHVLGDQGWKPYGNLPGHVKGVSDSWGTDDPNANFTVSKSDRYVWVDQYAPVSGTVWKFSIETTKWEQTQPASRIAIDIPLTDTPADFNVWAYKDTTLADTVKWASVGTGLAGAALTGSAIMFPDNPSAESQQVKE